MRARARRFLPLQAGHTKRGGVNLSHLRARRRRSKALDPTKHFVVTFALFCNGEVSGGAAGAAVERVGGALTFGRVFFRDGFAPFLLLPFHPPDALSELCGVTCGASTVFLAVKHGTSRPGA